MIKPDSFLYRDIFLENPNVKWSDIVGLDNAKKLLNEAVAMPLKYPMLFTGLLTPWKGILLYGPPGTGKTMLAKAVASMSRTTFFNISAASIVSKWRGDSEKLVRVLFELARHHAPSTIFLDEIDALMSHRGGDSGGEHEASRRMKTELLIQVDGLAKSTEQVFLLAVSNLPWTLDSALLRRLEKRIYVPLPNKEAREDMFRHYLPPEMAPKISYDSLAAHTEGYSGSDIRLVCKESAMAPLRRLVDSLEKGEKQYNEELKTEPVTTDDVNRALQTTKSSAHRDLEKYMQWQQEFGSV
eukprot:Phypoly_transcript_11918.p1 GENE.Phypoly_transcript_11918~~Phypoly_transcript_11918.p1  ORF type:complete len:298 (+),score=49.17 Phypoly_transcript_11918:251-1144(+)